MLSIVDFATKRMRATFPALTSIVTNCAMRSSSPMLAKHRFCGHQHVHARGRRTDLVSGCGRCLCPRRRRGYPRRFRFNGLYGRETSAQRLHVSVQASASNSDAIQFLVDAFKAKRVVLPRVLTIADIAKLGRKIDCEMEVFVFGGLCVMAEGRCSLSSYATGRSPNMNGVCSPASHVRYRQDGQELVSSSVTIRSIVFQWASPPAIRHSVKVASILQMSKVMHSKTRFRWTS